MSRLPEAEIERFIDESTTLFRVRACSAGGARLEEHARLHADDVRTMIEPYREVYWSAIMGETMQLGTDYFWIAVTRSDAYLAGLTCQECGNDDATEGYAVCFDCLEELGDAAPLSA